MSQPRRTAAGNFPMVNSIQKRQKLPYSTVFKTFIQDWKFMKGNEFIGSGH
jgi:hypothetical protein